MSKIISIHEWIVLIAFFLAVDAQVYGTNSKLVSHGESRLYKLSEPAENYLLVLEMDRYLVLIDGYLLKWAYYLHPLLRTNTLPCRTRGSITRGNGTHWLHVHTVTLITDRRHREGNIQYTPIREVIRVRKNDMLMIEIFYDRSCKQEPLSAFWTEAQNFTPDYYIANVGYEASVQIIVSEYRRLQSPPRISYDQDTGGLLIKWDHIPATDLPLYGYLVKLYDSATNQQVSEKSVDKDRTTVVFSSISYSMAYFATVSVIQAIAGFPAVDPEASEHSEIFQPVPQPPDVKVKQICYGAIVLSWNFNLNQLEHGLDYEVHCFANTSKVLIYRKSQNSVLLADLIPNNVYWCSFDLLLNGYPEGDSISVRFYQGLTRPINPKAFPKDPGFVVVNFEEFFSGSTPTEDVTYQILCQPFYYAEGKESPIIMKNVPAGSYDCRITPVDNCNQKGYTSEFSFTVYGAKSQAPLRPWHLIIAVAGSLLAAAALATGILIYRYMSQMAAINHSLRAIVVKKSKSLEPPKSSHQRIHGDEKVSYCATVGDNPSKREVDCL